MGMTLTAVATVAVALTAAPTDAFAQRYYRGGGAAIGLGVLNCCYGAAAPVSRWQSQPVSAPRGNVHLHTYWGAQHPTATRSPTLTRR
jgi:hypothetical protein